MLNPPEVPTLRFYNTEKETFICVSANLFRQVIGLEDTELVTLLPTCGGRYRPSKYCFSFYFRTKLLFLFSISATMYHIKVNALSCIGEGLH